MGDADQLSSLGGFRLPARRWAASRLLVTVGCSSFTYQVAEGPTRPLPGVGVGAFGVPVVRFVVAQLPNCRGDFFDTAGFFGGV